MRRTPSTMVSCCHHPQPLLGMNGVRRHRPPHLAPPFLSPQMTLLSGNGGCWWQRCCSSQASSSSPVRAGLGQRGRRDWGWASWVAQYLKVRGLESPWARLYKLSTPRTTPAVTQLSLRTWAESAGGAVLRILPPSLHPCCACSCSGA